MKRLVPLAIAATLLLTSCKPSTIVTTLEAIITAAEIAIPVIGAATGLPPQTSALVITYLQDVSTATGQASTILAGSGTPAEKAASIVQVFAKITAGIQLPGNTPPEIQAVLTGVMQAIASFLSNVGAQPVPAINVSFSEQDKGRLSSIRVRTNASLGKLSAMKR
jgi:hypothetical protein